jgi:hypothetical protein
MIKMMEVIERCEKQLIEVSEVTEREMIKASERGVIRN